MRFISVATVALALGPASSLALINPFQTPQLVGDIWKAVGLPDLAAPFKTTLQLAEADLDGLAARMEAIAAEGSGNWLSDEELEQYVTPSADTVATVTKYLTARGVNPSTIEYSKFGDQVTFVSSIGNLELLFKTKFENFKLNVEQGFVVPRAKNYTIPTALNGLVKSAYPIFSFGVPKQLTPLQSPDESSSAELSERASFSQCKPKAVTPACLRDAYETSSYSPSAPASQFSFSSIFDLSIISLIGQNFKQADLTAFLKKYRPDASSYRPQVTNTAGGVTFEFFAAGVEVMLDIETSVAQTYPLSNRILNYGGQLTQGDLFNLIAQHYLKMDASKRPGVISISYGSDEASHSPADAQTMCASMQKLTATGTTVVVASGDKGVAGTGGRSCAAPGSAFIPTYPSGCPYVVSVGATENFPEQMVSIAGSRFTSGAGFSNYFSRPSYQDSAVKSYLSKIGSANAGQYNSAGRSYPDVAAAGSNYTVVQNGQNSLVGGTSAACPTVASLFALVNDARRKVGKGRVGYVHPTLYANPSAFSDITSGVSAQCGSGGSSGFSATSGFDTSSGLGAPRFSKLRAIFDA
ncbi:hypothetical protein V8E36_000857 [Tilletia maclaganii]